jgi:hypothetical protein
MELKWNEGRAIEGTALVFPRSRSEKDAGFLLTKRMISINMVDKLEEVVVRK